MLAPRLYDRIRPLIVVLGLVELGCISHWLLMANPTTPRFVMAVWIWSLSLLAWLGIASILGQRGVFLRYTRWFSNLIGFASVLAFSALVFVAFSSLRNVTIAASAQLSNRELIAFHMLRLTSIGTIIKYHQGELPFHFFAMGSLTDFLFALSAIAIAILVGSGAVDDHFLVGWHVIGTMVFLGAGVSMFFSVPSTIRWTHAKPDTSIVFQYPMNLAPNFTVPLFVVAHAIALLRLLAT